MNVFRKTETIRTIIIDDTRYSITGRQVKYLIEKFGKRMARALLRGDSILNVETDTIIYIEKVTSNSEIVLSGYDKDDFYIPELHISHRGTELSISNDI